MSIAHTFEPIYDKNSNILILGTFPSVKSRENNFYYGHKQNRFWKLMCKILNWEEVTTIEEKKNMLLKNNIALWDVIKSCDIVGSSDSSITNVIPNDIETIVNKSKINRIILNGNKAGALYKKYFGEKLNIESKVLPSTSPANAKINLDKLYEIWSKEIY